MFSINRTSPHRVAVLPNFYNWTFVKKKKKKEKRSKTDKEKTFEVAVTLVCLERTTRICRSQQEATYMRDSWMFTTP